MTQTYLSNLEEIRHIFLNGNDLTTRLAQLNDDQYFYVGDTEFGIGLNILALLQLWQNVRPKNHSHLHAISIAQQPMDRIALQRALQQWHKYLPFAQQLIEQYPSSLISGCHRFIFPNEHFSLDLWLGDDIQTEIIKTHPVNAWFLNDNPPIREIIDLSSARTTFSGKESVPLKQKLLSYDLNLCHEKNRLKGILDFPFVTPPPAHFQNISIIGAGIAGLTTALGFAQRGHKVTLFEKKQPLAGASGNPLALLNPKLSSHSNCNDHLITLSWKFALPYYQKFNAFKKINVEQVDIKKIENLNQLTNLYSKEIYEIADSDLQTEFPKIQFKSAGVIQPHQLKDEILNHPNITLRHLHITKITKNDECVILNDHIFADQIILCTSYESHKIIEQHPKLQPIRGQVSWCDTVIPLQQAYSYGGYCMQLNPKQLILGASFHPDNTNTQVSIDDHHHNLALIEKIYPTYSQTLPSTQNWQGRASIRAQSVDYFPIVGKIQNRIYTLTGLGSRGFLYAPLCSETLIAHILREACPTPKSLVRKITPQRFEKKQRIRKPYYKKVP